MNRAEWIALLVVVVFFAMAAVMASAHPCHGDSTACDQYETISADY